MFGELERCVTILLFGTLLPPLNSSRLVVPFVQLQPTQLVCRVALPFVRRLFEELFGVVGLSFLSTGDLRAGRQPLGAAPMPPVATTSERPLDHHPR